MRILHTSDWHLGKRLDDFSRLDEQREVLNEIIEIANEQDVDAVLIAGDLFDTYNPPTEAVDLFYRSLKRLTNNGSRPVIAIAGNHDSPDRIESPDPLARECGIVFIGYPNTVVPSFELESGFKVLKSAEGFVELQLPRCNEPLRILHTAYANEFRMKTYLGSENNEQQLRDMLATKWGSQVADYCDSLGCNLLVSHLFFIKEGADLPEEPEDEKPILHVGGAQAIFSGNVPGGLHYVALGHLHRKQIVDSAPCPIVYSGSPLSYSFSEANQSKYVMIVDMEVGGNVAVKEIPLAKGKRLLRYRADGVEKAIEWLQDNTDALVELTLVSDTYITAQERKQLLEVHPNIISIIPDIKSKELMASEKSMADLSKNTEELFRDYFIKEKGQEPSDSLMTLFKEMLAEEEA
ncbi:metallophosphoesterase family protein [Acetobacteroides hydrogenigenes]|uniref:Nuclease SbcCD subunit D n=1 Tax=Acetobacteroides hydrogenigenes TaxID=979970 RepID=A0A4R2EHE4_9BACT|nr:exonuclease SbcCD subunit D [Acetobacteroides hydrogenigenes]TCN67625.1 exonuclease SbcD [Acetobacteroides hydrogenigenes]